MRGTTGSPTPAEPARHGVAQVGSRPEWARHRAAAGEGGELWRHRGGGTCEWLLHDMCALPAHWSGRFDAVVDKGGLCAAIFAGEAYAAAACREVLCL